MSESAEVKVFYGYVWQEHNEDGHGDFAEGNVCEGRESDWAKAIAVRRGAVDPWASFVPSTAPDWQARDAENRAWCDEHDAELDAHCELVEAIEAEFGVDYGRHGHIDYSARYLAIASTVQSGEWTEAIDLSTLPPVDPVWREQLDRWLAEFNIDAPQDAPRWWAVTCYG